MILSLQNWQKYQDKLVQIAASNDREMLVEIRNDGQERYWVVDIDYSFVDRLGQLRAIGCIQLDVGNAQRLDISYLDNSSKQRISPVIIHAAVPGGLERYLYMAFDKLGEKLPLWLQPIQLRIIPVSAQHLSACLQIVAEYPQLRIDIDDNADPVSKRVKRAHVEAVPYQLVVGDKELEPKARKNGFVDLAKLIPELFAQLSGMSSESKILDIVNAPILWPRQLSKRID